jgi:hypothetical protein
MTKNRQTAREGEERKVGTDKGLVEAMAANLEFELKV